MEQNWVTLSLKLNLANPDHLKVFLMVGETLKADNTVGIQPTEPKSTKSAPANKLPKMENPPAPPKATKPDLPVTIEEDTGITKDEVMQLVRDNSIKHKDEIQTHMKSIGIKKLSDIEPEHFAGIVELCNGFNGK